MNLAVVRDALLAVLIAIVLVSLYSVLSAKHYFFIPYYAVVLLDDDAKTYIALPCIDDWQRRPNKKFDALRLRMLDEAWKLAYKLDEECAIAGGYNSESRTRLGEWLVSLGMLSPVEHWWDAPYQTKEGIVIPRGVKRD